MALQTPWVRYIDRTYQQIKDNVLTKLQALVPEITDHTESNLWVKLIGIWAGLTEQIGYYVDSAARETFITTCRLYRSAVKLSRTHDYRIKARRAATVDLLFTIDAPAPSPITIPVNTHIQTAAGRSFYTVTSATIATGNTSVRVSARQVDSFVTGQILGVSNGTANQQFNIPDLDFTDQSISITIAALAWASKETLGYDNYLGEVFVQTVDEINLVKTPVVIFGDGAVNGAIPPAGQNIVAAYERCAGASGNVEANTITDIQTIIILPPPVTSLTCTNPERASGGAEIETLNLIRYRLPRSIRTLLRAGSFQDHIDIAELANGVALAGVDFSCGRNIEIYIVPEGGGIASNALISSVVTWFQDKKFIGTFIDVFAAGEVRIQLTVNVTALSAFSNAVVAASVETNLLNFLSFQFQKINGRVNISDLYEVIENTQGVLNSVITGFVAAPYATPRDGTTTPLNWTRTTLPASTTNVNWRIVFVNASDFQLFRNNVFVGTFTTGALVSQTEIEFTISGSYATNDVYTFVSYPYNPTNYIQLSEPSLPVSLSSDLTINVTGGV